MKNIKSKIFLTTITVAVCGGIFLSTSAKATVEGAKAAALADNLELLESNLADGTPIEEVANMDFLNILHSRGFQRIEGFLLDRAERGLYERDRADIEALVRSYYPGFEGQLPTTMPEGTHFENRTLRGASTTNWYAQNPAAPKAFDKISDVVSNILLPYVFRERRDIILLSDGEFRKFLEFVGKIRQIIQRNAGGQDIESFGELYTGHLLDPIDFPQGSFRDRALGDVHNRPDNFQFGNKRYFFPQYTIQLGSENVELLEGKFYGACELKADGSFSFQTNRTYTEHTYPAHRKLMTDILNLAGRTPGEIEAQLPDLLLEFAYEFSWSCTYSRGQAAICFWYLRSLARAVGYDLVLTGRLAPDAEEFPIDVLALTTENIRSFKALCRDYVRLRPIS